MIKKREALTQDLYQEGNTDYDSLMTESIVPSSEQAGTLRGRADRKNVRTLKSGTTLPYFTEGLHTPNSSD